MSRPAGPNKSPSVDQKGLTKNGPFHKSGNMRNTDAIEALSALAQITRLEAFRLLVRHQPDGIAAGELARFLDVPPNTLSSHLSILSHAGLVAGERKSRNITYQANIDVLQDLVLFMLQDCCGGRPEVCAPLVKSLESAKPSKTKSTPRGAAK